MKGKSEIPKSLHTVTVLCVLAREYIANGGKNVRDAVNDAAQRLGYSGAADTYGLIGKAVAVLSKELAK